MPDKNWQFELEEYIKQGEPDRAEKSETWQTAIGLQAVDGLNTSAYLLDTAKKHIDFADENTLQSINSKVSKYQFDTLDCTLEELAVLELVAKNPAIKQQEIAEQTGKSIATIKRIMKSLQDKNYIRRESGKRYGKWEVLV